MLYLSIYKVQIFCRKITVNKVIKVVLDRKGDLQSLGGKKTKANGQMSTNLPRSSKPPE